MVRIYAIVLALGVVLLIAWIFAAYVAANVPAWRRFDPEERLGKPGRRVVAGMIGLGMAGMSAEFSPFELSWPVALILAIVGGSAMVWYASFVDRAGTGSRPVARTGDDQT